MPVIPLVNTVVMIVNNPVIIIHIAPKRLLFLHVLSLCTSVIAATKKLYPDVHLEVRNSLGSALYCKDNSERKLTAEDIRSIEEYMHKMAERKESIKLLRLPKSSALTWKELPRSDFLCMLPSDA